MKRFSGILCYLVLIAVAVLFNQGAPTPSMFSVTGNPGDISVLPLAGITVINASVLQAVFTNLKTTFNKAFSAAETVWEKIAMKVPSTGSQNDYPWIDGFPRMKKWVGDKVVKALKGHKYTIVNDDWEATVEVDRNHIEDDNLGIYAPMAQMAGESAKQLPDEIIIDLVNNGFANPCYDGQYFFDTDHPVINPTTGEPASVSNKGTAALSCATLAAAQASLGAARTAMKKFKNDEGQPLNVKPNILLVPPALEDTANVLANNERLEDGKQNPYKGSVQVEVDARLESDTAWFLFDTSKPVKPLIYQERKAPVFVQMIDMNAPDVFSRKMYKFGAEARCAGGYGFWQLAYGSTGV